MSNDPTICRSISLWLQIIKYKDSFDRSITDFTILRSNMQSEYFSFIFFNNFLISLWSIGIDFIYKTTNNLDIPCRILAVY